MSSLRPAEPQREQSRASFSRLSLVWLLPLAAIVFAAFVLWQSIAERGPLVRIQFDDAGGVKAGETVVRRNDVDVGVVEAVRLADDLDSVIIDARMDPLVAPFIDEGARFWIVNARLTTTEISGLSTLLSGSYVGVDWDDIEGEAQREFDGLEVPPLTARGTPGRRLTLAAEEAGFVDVGSPVFFRQIEIGRVERRRLSSDATEVLFDIFVEEPYHMHIYPESRFFVVSGLAGGIGADGIDVRVESVSAFFTGGIAFENPAMVDGLEPIERDGSRFRLYDGRKSARDSVFQGEDDEQFRFMARFEGSVKGLNRDAPVEYNGIRVGRVADVTIELPPAPGSLPISVAVLQLQPRRLGLGDASYEEFLAGLNAHIESGLRLQLATGNLLTGSLIARFVSDDSAQPASLDPDAQPYPEIPTTASNIEAVTRDVEALIANLSELPLNELVMSATGLITDVRALVASPEIGELPTQLSDSLDSLVSTARGFETAASGLPSLIATLTSVSRNADDVLQGVNPDSEIYIELSGAVRELRAAARSIAGFAEYLEDNPNAVLTGRR